MGCHPSHWLSYFSRWLLHHQPVTYFNPFFIWDVWNRGLISAVGENLWKPSLMLVKSSIPSPWGVPLPQCSRIRENNHNLSHRTPTIPPLYPMKLLDVVGVIQYYSLKVHFPLFMLNVQTLIEGFHKLGYPIVYHGKSHLVMDDLGVPII